MQRRGYWAQRYATSPIREGLSCQNAVLKCGDEKPQSRKQKAAAPDMPVNATRPDYDASGLEWSRARDVLAGEDAVKAAGEKHLPRLDCQSDEEFAAYRKRAAFFNATARTAEGYIGLMFRRQPFVEVPGHGTTGLQNHGTTGRAAGRTFPALQHDPHRPKGVASAQETSACGWLIARSSSGPAIVSPFPGRTATT